MILLDYCCPRCGHISEEFVIDKDVQTPCPRCNTFKERMVSAVGMVKGNSGSPRGFRDRTIKRTN